MTSCAARFFDPAKDDKNDIDQSRSRASAPSRRARVSGFFVGAGADGMVSDDERRFHL
jgi:hypothetical protein